MQLRKQRLKQKYSVACSRLQTTYFQQVLMTPSELLITHDTMSVPDLDIFLITTSKKPTRVLNAKFLTLKVITDRTSQVTFSKKLERQKLECNSKSCISTLNPRQNPR